MSEFKIGQEVVVVVAGAVYSSYDSLATQLELTNWAEGEQLAEGTTAVVAGITQHPGFGSETEAAVVRALFGLAKHPEEGSDILVLQADGKQYLYRFDAVVATGVEDTILDAQQDLADKLS